MAREVDDAYNYIEPPPPLPDLSGGAAFNDPNYQYLLTWEPPPPEPFSPYLPRQEYGQTDWNGYNQPPGTEPEPQPYEEYLPITPQRNSPMQESRGSIPLNNPYRMPSVPWYLLNAPRNPLMEERGMPNPGPPLAFTPGARMPEQRNMPPWTYDFFEPTFSPKEEGRGKDLDRDYPGKRSETWKGTVEPRGRREGIHEREKYIWKHAK